MLTNVNVMDDDFLYMGKMTIFNGKSFWLIFRQMVLQALEKGSKQEAKKILDLQSWLSQGNRGFRPTQGPKNVIRSSCDRTGLKGDPAGWT